MSLGSPEGGDVKEHRALASKRPRLQPPPSSPARGGMALPSWVGVERWGHRLLGAFCGPLLQGRALGRLG